jgi:hypothetical protein
MFWLGRAIFICRNLGAVKIIFFFEQPTIFWPGSYYGNERFMFLNIVFKEYLLFSFEN